MKKTKKNLRLTVQTIKKLNEQLRDNLADVQGAKSGCCSYPTGGPTEFNSCSCYNC
jgi:hypothetical protein